MNPATFLESFGHIADAPGGIDKLRALILDLAVRGRLTHQDPNDEPASIAINSARASRNSWIDATAPDRRNTDKDWGNPLGEFDVPSSWENARLDDVLQLVNGRAYKKAEWRTTGTPVIRIQNLNGGEDYYYSDLDLAPHNYCDDGDLLFAWSASFGPYIWTGSRAIFHYHIWKIVISPALVRRYGFFLLRAMTAAVKASSHGLAMLHVTKALMEGLVCPIPPVAEQHRIVNRVDQLMALCDDLEAQQARRERTRIDFTTSTLHHLADADSVEDIRHHLRLLTDNIDLHLAPGAGDLAVLKELRRTILDLAVRGRLTHQDPNDEPASDLLERIRAERERMVAAKEIRKPKRLPPIDVDVLHELPLGWEWVRAGEFYLASDSGWSPKCHVEPAEPGEWGVLKTSAVSTGRFDARENKALPSSLTPRPQFEIQSGDFVMIRASGSKGLVGMGAIVTDFDAHLMLSDKHIRLAFHSSIATRFWSMLNQSSDVQAHYSSESSGTSTMSNVTRDRIALMAVAVPPLAEQRRIVERFDQLITACDELETQFLAAQAHRSDLATATMHHAVRSPTETEVLL